MLMIVAELSQFNCSPNEEITALQSMSLSSANGRSQPYLCVGTFTYHADEKEPAEGRLLLFDIHEIPSSSGQQLALVTSLDVHGCVYALTNLDQMIAAAINASVPKQRNVQGENLVLMSSEGGGIPTREIGSARCTHVDIEEGDGVAAELSCQKPCVIR
jgi:hypothetical protein